MTNCISGYSISQPIEFECSVENLNLPTQPRHPPAVEIAFAHAEVGAGFLFGEELLFEIFGARRISCRVHADVGMATERGGVGVVANGDNQFASDVPFRHLA